MIVRRAVVAALALSLCAAPLTPARASAAELTSDSKLGVLFMVVCGLAAKVIPIAPVPFAGIAFVSCAAGLIDAALSPDGPEASPEDVGP